MDAHLHKIVIPLYIGLNLQDALAYFADAARDFADHLRSDFQVDLYVPEEEAAGHGTLAAGEARRRPSAEAWLAASPFRWQRPLHMTTFYFGGGPAAGLLAGAVGALELEGSRWHVRPTHLLCAEGALLVAAVEVLDATLPMEPGCLPHVTLLVCHPFMPGDARGLVAHAAAAGLLEPDAGAGEEATLLAVPQVPVGGSIRDLYVQRLLPGVAPLLQGRLESFWHRGRS